MQSPYSCTTRVANAEHLYLACVLAAAAVSLPPPQGTSRSDVNDGIISRPRLLARDPTLFSLLQYIFTPSVARMRYRSICLACLLYWTPEALVPLLEPSPPVSAVPGLLPCATAGVLPEAAVLPYCCTQ
jgi:hypothetical protein